MQEAHFPKERVPGRSAVTAEPLGSNTLRAVSTPKIGNANL